MIINYNHDRIQRAWSVSNKSASILGEGLSNRWSNEWQVFRNRVCFSLLHRCSLGSGTRDEPKERLRRRLHCRFASAALYEDLTGEVYLFWNYDHENW